MLAYFHFAAGGTTPLLLAQHTPRPDAPSLMSAGQTRFLSGLQDELKDQGESP